MLREAWQDEESNEWEAAMERRDRWMRKCARERVKHLGRAEFAYLRTRIDNAGYDTGEVPGGSSYKWEIRSMENDGRVLLFTTRSNDDRR